MRQTFSHPFKVMIIIAGLFFFFSIGMESLAFARAGGGRSSGTSGYRSGGSYQRTMPSRPSQQVMPQRPPMQQPMAQPSAGRSFLSGLGGGLVGGMLGSMLFGGHGHAGGGYGGGGSRFGFGDLIILLIILGVVYFVVKRFRANR